MRAIGLLLLCATAHAHDRGDASLKVALGADDVVGVVVELSAEDVAQLTGRSDDAAKGASAFEQPLVDLAARNLRRWVRIAGDGQPCELAPDTASPSGPHRIRIIAAARCADEPAEIAFRWRAEANGLQLTASGTLVGLDGAHTPLTFPLGAEWHVVKVRSGVPGGVWPALLWGLVLLAVVVWRRMVR